MPDIGLFELIMIGLALVVIVGPERVPEFFGLDWQCCAPTAAVGGRPARPGASRDRGTQGAGSAGGGGGADGDRSGDGADDDRCG